MLLHYLAARPVMGPSGHAVSRTDPIRWTSPLRALRVLALILAIEPGGESAAAAFPPDTPVASSDQSVAEPTPPAEPGRRRPVFCSAGGGES